MNGEYVGLWQLTPRGEEFQYADTWIASATSRPILLKFPLASERKAHAGAEVRDYFDNLLLDTKAIRERMARRFHIGAIDAYSLLAKLGRDCVGALQIVPANEAPPNVRSIACRPLTSAEIATHLRTTTLPSNSNFYDDKVDDDFRISLAGAQEKTALPLRKGKWHRSLGATLTTHILKLPLGRVGNMQLNIPRLKTSGYVPKLLSSLIDALRVIKNGSCVCRKKICAEPRVFHTYKNIKPMVG